MCWRCLPAEGWGGIKCLPGERGSELKGNLDLKPGVAVGNPGAVWVGESLVNTVESGESSWFTLRDLDGLEQVRVGLS